LSNILPKIRLNSQEVDSKKELSNLIDENNDLKKQVQAQKEGYERFCDDVKEALSFVRQEVETFRRNEVTMVNCTRSNELEVSNRIDLLLKEVETLRNERSVVNNANDLKIQTLLGQLEQLKEHTTNFELNVLRDAEDYINSKISEVNNSSPRMEEEMIQINQEGPCSLKWSMVQENRVSPPVLQPTSGPSEKLRGKKRKLRIPWCNKILTPSKYELLKFKGDMAEIERKLGAREPLGKEKDFKKARIVWKGEILWAFPTQIQEVAGDLDQLAKLLPKSEKVRLKASFRKQPKKARGNSTPRRD